MACRDGLGTPYEITLELHRDGALYGTVGERCGRLLAGLARGVAEARAGHQAWWPDPDDRFPGEAELFAFRYRARNGVVGGGELRCRLRTVPLWVPGRRGPAGEWRLTRRAVVEAGGDGGPGLRAVLTSAELGAFVGDIVAEAEDALGPYRPGKPARTL
ncbi:hypothetical protein [Streptosporangium longisporum]|uniref:Polyketide cyclase / dehydrase and lipid transport n=1 Tax=Streptosporangium longisporum TaxID=46187 RepID=A0ABP6L0F8_9ACTN